MDLLSVLHVSEQAMMIFIGELYNSNFSSLLTHWLPGPVNYSATQ